MKVLVFGASGFIGRSVVELLETEHQVYRAYRKHRDEDGAVTVDLLNYDSILVAIEEHEPDVIINCAGIVDASAMVQNNVTFTKNILRAAYASHLTFHRIIILGSAAEYGIVRTKDDPIDEDYTRTPVSGYGQSKFEECNVAVEYREKYKLPVVVVRIFNPIGSGMHGKFLISKLIDQLSDYKKGLRNSIEVTRLDSSRDYVSVKDVSSAIKRLIESNPLYAVYNVGSGKASSNRELIELILKHSKIQKQPSLKETSEHPEVPVASVADIHRIKEELDWSPHTTLDDEIKEIMNARI